MSEPMVAYRDGSWCCYQLDGRRPRFIGCSHKTSRAAIDHRANLDPFVSPTRREREAVR